MNRGKKIKNYRAFFGFFPIKFFVCLVLFFLSLFSVPAGVSAGGVSLYIFPPSGTYKIGDTFTLSVRVGSAEEAINAAEGTLIFNPAEVQVLNVSSSGSIFNLWTSEPSFSNSDGTANFSGGSAKSFTGASGTVMTLSMKAKASVTTQVGFSSGSVLAADGKGTNLISQMNGGSYTFSPVMVIPPPELTPPEIEQPNEKNNVPYAPVVTSATHPDPNQWYANNSPEFSWTVPEGITAIRFSLDNKPYGAPGDSNSADIFSTKKENLADGIWYFHIQFKNSDGWGSILHRKVMVDKAPPEPFNVSVDNGGDPTNPAPLLKIETSDKSSGLAHYELKIGSAPLVSLSLDDVKDGIYKIPVQEPGIKTAIVKVYDLAGNVAMVTVEIPVEPLEKPVINPLPESIREGEVLIVRGSSKYPDARIVLSVKKEGEEPTEQETITDSKGDWVLVYERSVTKGAYQIWAKIADRRGAESMSTGIVTLAVLPPVIIRIGYLVADYFGAFILVLGLIAILVLAVCFGLYLIKRMRRHLRSKTEELAYKIYISYEVLLKNIHDEIEYLDGKPGLSKTESAVRNKLQEALNESEKSVSNVIKDIEKELKIK